MGHNKQHQNIFSSIKTIHIDYVPYETGVYRRVMRLYICWKMSVGIGPLLAVTQAVAT